MKLTHPSSEIGLLEVQKAGQAMPAAPSYAPILDSHAGPYRIRHDLHRVVPLKHRRYSKRMTLALGILCRGGVVLGVDTEIGVDGGKIGGPKIQVFWRSLPDYNVVSASAGHADSIETARVEIEESLDRLDKTKRPAVKEIRRAISEALQRVYTQHIDPLPSLEERNFMDFTLLLAIRVGRSARLFRTNRAQVVEQDNRWCMGSGKEFADYLFDTLLDNHPSFELAAQLAAYVIDVTKDHIDGVGHISDVHVIEANGNHWSLYAPQIQQIETAFAEFFKTLRSVIDTADPRFTSEESVPIMLGFLGDRIRDLRTAQNERMELRARIQASIEANLQDPQPTTGDPRSQRPSRESPSVSDES